MRYDPSPDAPEEQEGAREGQAPTSLCRVPIPYWFWCCPSSAHRGQRAQGRVGQGGACLEESPGPCPFLSSGPSHQLLAQGALSTEAA